MRKTDSLKGRGEREKFWGKKIFKQNSKMLNKRCENHSSVS